MTKTWFGLATASLVASALFGCSSNSSTSTGAGGSNAQTPPQGMAAVEAWLATGEYKS